MSLTFNFKNLYVTYHQLSFEELERRLARAKEESAMIENYSKRFECECKANVVPIDLAENPDGTFVVEFHKFPKEQMCKSCYEALFSFIGAGKPDAEQLHPRLYCHVNHQHVDLLEMAIYAKRRNFHELTNEELLREIEDAYQHSRYLRRTETDFDWRDEPTPPGLGDAVHDNYKDMGALEFVRKSRVTAGLLPSS